MNNEIGTKHEDAFPHEAPVNVGKLFTENTNVGIIRLNAEGNQLDIIGFDGLKGHRGRLELVNNVLLITPDEDPTVHDTVLFDGDVLKSPIMIDYLKQLEAIDCLFVRVWNVFTQCKGVFIYDSTE